MRQQVTTVSAAGQSPWLFVDSRRYNGRFNASLAVTLSQAATLTYTVELTYDQNSKERDQQVSISRAATVATITLNDHGLQVGDSVVLFDSNFTTHSPESNFEGVFQVATTPTDNTYTITVANTGTTSGIARQRSFRVFNHPTLQGDTADEGGVQNEPVTAVRLNVTSYTGGSAQLTVLQQG